MSSRLFEKSTFKHRLNLFHQYLYLFAERVAFTKYEIGLGTGKRDTLFHKKIQMKSQKNSLN